MSSGIIHEERKGCHPPQFQPAVMKLVVFLNDIYRGRYVRMKNMAKHIRHVGLIIIFAIAFATFANEPRKQQDSDWFSYAPSPNDIATYFQGRLSKNNGASLAAYDARFLHFMDEKPLRDGLSPSISQIFRVLVATRPHNLPLVVRLTIKTDGTGEVIVKLIQDFRHKQVWAPNLSTTVPFKEVDRFLKLLANSGFWSLATLPPFDVDKRQSMGDASWMLEGTKDGSYQVVCRNTATLGTLRSSLLYLIVDVGKIKLSDLGS